LGTKGLGTDLASGRVTFHEGRVWKEGFGIAWHLGLRRDFFWGTLLILLWEGLEDGCFELGCPSAVFKGRLFGV